MKSLIAALFLAVTSTICFSASTPEPTERKVMAFYYTWYGTPEFQSRWIHWDEGGHNPDSRNGMGVPDTGTTNHPLELYDSNDPAVIRKHLQIAQKAQIDVLISTWWAQNDYHDKAARALLAEAEKTPVKVSFYYERVPASDSSDSVDKTVEDFAYILNTHAKSPAFFTHNGRPVIFIYSRAVGQLSKDQWTQVVKKLKQKQLPVMLVGDTRSAEWLDVFDAIHEYNSVWQVTAGEDYDKQARKLVEDSKKRGRVSAVTIIPGYDDSNIGRKTPTIAQRRNGALYREMWSAAIRNRPDWILICSFNEWHEGSEIEPSREYQNLFVDLTFEYASNFKYGKNGSYISPSLSDKAVLTTRENLLTSFVSDSTGAVIVTNLDSRPGRISYTTKTPGKLLVFERGRSGQAFRRIPAYSERNTIAWQARPYTYYEVWPQEDLSSFLLSTISKRVKPKPSGKDPLSLLETAAGNTSVNEDPSLSLLLHEFLAFRKGIRSELQMKFPDKMPQTYRICVDQPFEITCSLYNSSSKPVKASIAHLSCPDAWKVSPLSANAGKPRVVPAGGKVTVKYSVTAPIRSVYDKQYPVTAWWKVSDSKGSCRVQSSAGVKVYHPFEKQADYKAASPTKAEMTLTLSNNFPGQKMKNLNVELDLPQGWTGTPRKTTLTLDKTATLKFALSRPSDEDQGLKIAGAVFRLGQYVGSKRSVLNLHLELGTTARTPGLWLVDVEDGRTEVVTKDGRTCCRAADFMPGQPCYIYFGVSENLPVSDKVYVTVHYFDEGTDPFELHYDSSDPVGGLWAAYKNTEKAYRSNSLTWKTHTFVLSDARFANGQNGQADFRIASHGSGIYVDWVSVSKFPAPL